MCNIKENQWCTAVKMAQNLNLALFLKISRSNISKLRTFLKNKFLLKLKVIFSTNFRPKTRKIIRAVFEKNISVWFWANLENFSRISPNQKFFKNPALSLFYLYSPLTSCKKIRKILRAVSEKTVLPTNQPNNQPLPTTPIL